MCLQYSCVQCYEVFTIFLHALLTTLMTSTCKDLMKLLAASPSEAVVDTDGVLEVPVSGLEIKGALLPTDIAPTRQL